MDTHKSLSTASLILYYKLLREISSRCKLYLSENQDQQTEEYIKQTIKLEEVNQTSTLVKQELDRRKNILKFSVEEIYQIVGSRDAYVMINFFPGSDAYEKYGESVYGNIWYHKQERERLNMILTEGQISRTNGDIFLSSGINDESMKHKLQYEGFKAMDICEIYATGSVTDSSTYKQSGTKTIPNTTTININARTFNVVNSQLYVLGHYLKDGFSLPRHDLVLYYSNLYLFKRDKITDSEIEKYLLKEDKSGFSDLADFTIHDIKAREKIATEDELEYYKKLLMQRSKDRIHFITKHLGITEKKLNELISSDFDKYMAIQTSTWMFETETLAYLSPNVVIYWEYERFIHIFLRHYPDFFIATSTKGKGTSFQYHFKDISRLVKIIIEELKSSVSEKLQAGKEFSAQGIYYNGNHYQIRIAADGKLLQFGPMD
ncbi:MAG: hypothetical protein QM768_12590 [Agriterribacter sp.]